MFRAAAGLLLAAALASGASAEQPGPGRLCEARAPQREVSIVVVASPERVRKFAATVRGAEVVRRDAKTVVFSDGRVVTSNVEAAGQHLNALGWSDRRIRIVASFRGGSAWRPRPG